MTQSNNNSSSELRDALMHDEDLIAAVRGHLYIEIQLNRLIERLVPYPEEIANSKLGWQQRVELALGLGLKSQYGPPLKKLGNIRNKFAHSPNASIEDKDIMELYQCLHREAQDVVLESFRHTQGQVDDPIEGEFNDLSAKDRFTLIVVALNAVLQLAVSKIAGK